MTDPTPQPEPSDSAETYQLEAEDLAGPPLPGIVAVRSTVEETIDHLAATLVAQAISCVRQFGDFHLALSGGSTPEPLYQLLMYDADYRALPWQRTHLWIVDERCVPMNHQQSNFRMISETIIDHVDIPSEQVHPIFAQSETADLEYEKQLKETLVWRDKGEDRMDFVLLGMGTDGHTASLFPNADILHENSRLVGRTDYEPVSPSKRITMTYSLINAARWISVLVTGSSKADAIQRVAVGHEPIEELPIKGIRPTDGTLYWHLDAAACGLCE